MSNFVRSLETITGASLALAALITTACSASNATPYSEGDPAVGGSPGAPMDMPASATPLPGQGDAFASMAPPLLEPLPRGPSMQWQYLEIPGTQCRDGTPAGLYTRFSDTSTNLVIYLEQGGACFNSALCAFNPDNVGERMTGRTLSEAVGGLEAVTQAPSDTGIFDATRPENPVADWNFVWIPYCTGDAHGGSSPNATIAGVDTPQQLVGYMNMQRFVGHIVPTFQDAGQVLLTGTSAGSIGAGLSFNQVQDAFGATPVTLVMDSAVPFSDAYMAPCLQRTWRDLWGFEALLPPECAECRHADGGGLLELVFFSAQKYPGARLGIISATEDDVMRFFYGFGEGECQGGGSYPDGRYTEALTDLRVAAAPYAGQFASYYVPGVRHMYEQFDDFYTPLSGGLSIASWLGSLLAGEALTVGP